MWTYAFSVETKKAKNNTQEKFFQGDTHREKFYWVTQTNAYGEHILISKRTTRNNTNSSKLKHFVKKCPNTEFFLVRIFLYSSWIRRFTVFELDTEIYSVNYCIQSEYRKIRTRKNSLFGHFSRRVHDKCSNAHHQQVWLCPHVSKHHSLWVL